MRIIGMLMSSMGFIIGRCLESMVGIVLWSSVVMLSRSVR